MDSWLENMQQLPSGLWVPVTEDKVPLDLMASYLTGTDLGLVPMTMSEIEANLTKLPMFVTVAGLCHVSCLMELYQSTNRDLQREFLEHCCPEPLAERIRPRLTEQGVGFSSPQVALATVTLALVHCPDVEEDGTTFAIGPLLIGVGDHMVGPSEARSSEELNLEITRYGIFYAPRYLRSLIGRYDLMLREIAPELASHPDYIDVQAAIEAATEIPFDDYLALGVGLYSVFSRKNAIMEGPWLMEISELELQIEQRVTDAFFDQWSAEAGWFSDRFQDAFSPWDFTVFQGKPLLRKGDRILPFSINFLLEKATSGIFYLILNWLRESNGDWERWTRFFGRLWEQYVRRLLAHSIGDDRLVSEDDLRPQWPADKKVADNIIVYPDRWLLVETVAKRLNLATVATGGPDALDSDLASAVVKKARQLADTVDVLREHPEVTGIQLDSYPPRFRVAIVLPGPFPVMPQVVARVRELVGADPACRSLFQTGIDPLIIMTADDLEALLGATETWGTSLDEEIQAWQSSNLAEMNAFIYLTEQHHRGFFASWTDTAARSSLERASKLMFGGSRNDS